MEIDPEALAAAGRLCARQQTHVEDMSSYLEGVLDRPEAFSGALTVFAGSYAGAVAAGRRGLADSARAAALMGRGMVRLRAEVLATDEEVARRMGRTRPGGAYDALPGGTPVTGAIAGPVRAPLSLRLLPTGSGADGGVPDPGPGDAGRDERRGLADLVAVALAADDALGRVGEQADEIGDSVRASADALGDLREQQELVAGAGSTPAAGEVAREARGWWR